MGRSGLAWSLDATFRGARDVDATRQVPRILPKESLCPEPERPPRRPLAARRLVRRPSTVLAGLAATALAIALSLSPAGPAARPVAAAGGVTLEARGLLAGHARVGSWMAIAVTVANDGPAIIGEVRINGGAQGRTRFGLPVDLPTGSRKSLELYAQPPAFGQFIEVSLITAAGTAATAKVSFSAPDTTQLVVGVLAEKSAPVVAAMRLPASISGTPAVVVGLTVADLPGRVEAWDPIDRLVWQDIDASKLRAGPARRPAWLDRRRRPAHDRRRDGRSRPRWLSSPTTCCRTVRWRRPTSARRRSRTWSGRSRRPCRRSRP